MNANQADFPVRHFEDGERIERGHHVDAATSARLAAQAQLLEACKGDKALARKLWKDRKTAPSADELEALLTLAEQMGAEQ